MLDSFFSIDLDVLAHKNSEGEYKEVHTDIRSVYGDRRPGAGLEACKGMLHVTTSFYATAEHEKESLILKKASTVTVQFVPNKILV
jgi:hypothetical protein